MKQADDRYVEIGARVPAGRFWPDRDGYAGYPHSWTIYGARASHRAGASFNLRLRRRARTVASMKATSNNRRRGP
jgi:hypothetical protein